MIEVPQTDDPATDPSPPVPALPVLPYRPPKDEPANGPSGRDVIAATVALSIALLMLGGAAGVFAFVLMSAREGIIFAAILLLFPLAIFLILAKTAFASAVRNIRGDSFTYEVRRSSTGREWGDVLTGIFVLLFSLALIAILLFIIPVALDENASPKKIGALLIIALVLVIVLISLIRPAWAQLDCSASIKRTIKHWLQPPKE